MFKTKNKGFTLLELLVVVAIIGILSSVVLVRMNTARATGRDGRRISDVHNIQNGLEIYYSTYKAYPATLAALTSSTPVSMKTIPVDPVNSGAFTYRYIPLSTNVAGTPCTGYHLGASLENNNKVLTTDSDVNSSTITSGSALKCNSALPGSNGGNGIFPALGTAESTTACDGTTAGYCYDLKR